MFPSIIICACTCLLMILSIPFKPVLKLGKLHVDSYWVIVLTGALLLLISGQVDIGTVGGALLENSAVIP